MEVFATAVWGTLTAAGSTLALTFIVALAIGINALALLFFGSAVVALEQFARAATRWRSLLLCGAGWSMVVGAGDYRMVIDVPSGAFGTATVDLEGRPRERKF